MEGGPTCKIILRRVMMNGLWPSLRMKNLLNGQKTNSIHPLHLRISSVPISIRCNEEQVVQKNISRCSCACDKQRDFLTVFSTAWECCAVLWNALGSMYSFALYCAYCTALSRCSVKNVKCKMTNVRVKSVKMQWCVGWRFSVKNVKCKMKKYKNVVMCWMALSLKCEECEVKNEKVKNGVKLKV